MDIDCDGSPLSSDLSSRDREPPRTKGTCDRCALSKVKCDRSKPHCVRCQLIGEDLGIAPPCHYTVSLRSMKRRNGRSTSKRNSTGRPRSSTESTQSTATPPTPESRPFTSSPMLDRDGSLDLGSEAGSAYGTPPMQPDLPLPTHIRHTKSEPGRPFGMMNLSTSAPNASPLAFPRFLRTPPQCPPSTPNSSAISRSNSNETPSINRTGCTALIYSCVNDMIQATNRNGCLAPQQPAPISLYQVLSLNQNVIDAFNKVLDCPCSNSPDSAFAIAYLLNTAFLFFRSAVESLMPKFDRPVGPTPLPNSVPPSRSTPMLPRLRSELEKISKLADEFNARYCRGGKGDAVQFQLFNYSLNMELKKSLDALDERAGGST